MASLSRENRTFQHKAIASHLAHPIPALLILVVLSASVASITLSRFQNAPTQDNPRNWIDSVQRLPLQSVAVEGHRMVYLDVGQGPPVILVHGLGGSLWVWENQWASLSAAHRVIAVDLLGFGLSDKPEIAYTPSELVRVFRDFMDAVGVQRATLVGNSMGAGLAAGMALTYPERVDRLILIDGLPGHVRRNLTSPLIRHTLETVALAPAWLLKLKPGLDWQGSVEEDLAEAVYDKSLLTPAVVARESSLQSRPGRLYPLLTLLKNLPLWEQGFGRQLGHIRHPTLIIWGAEDRIFPATIGWGLQTTVPGSKLVLIPAAGHLPQWERPELVNPILLEFLKLSEGVQPL